MIATVLDDKNIQHIDELCEEKSRIKAKLILRHITGHHTAWKFPANIKECKSFFTRAKVADAVPESLSDTGRTMDNVISTLSGEGLKALFGRESVANLTHTDIVLSIVKLQIVDLNKRDIKIKVLSGGGIKPLVGGSKLKFYLGDKSESSKTLGSKGFVGQVIRLSRVCDNDITVFSRKDKKNLAMGKLKQTQSIQDIELFEVRCI